MKKNNFKLDAEEQAIENEIENYVPVSAAEEKHLDSLVKKESRKKNITIRIDAEDLSLLRDKAAQYGMPYQTLISSTLHMFVTDQLLNKDNIKKSIALLKTHE